MKVFVSWSGETSRRIAEILKGWLPSVVQAVKPYYTPDDITKGTRWNTEISKELEECRVGLLCMTSDNLEAPWIMFEAGALSKSLSASRVCPLLFGIEASDIKGPLVQFQATAFTKDEMKKTIRMINQELETEALAPEVLDSVFEMWWPTLDEKIKKIMSTEKPAKKAVRSERDMLEEILERVRVAPGGVPMDQYSRIQEELSRVRTELELWRREAHVVQRRGGSTPAMQRLQDRVDEAKFRLTTAADDADLDLARNALAKARMELRHVKRTATELSPLEIELLNKLESEVERLELEGRALRFGKVEKEGA